MRVRIRNLARILSLAAFAMFAMTATARASEIDFSTGDAGSGGTITTDGTYWYGTGIPLDLMTVNGTTTYDLSGTGDGAAAGTNCCAVLNFDTSTGTLQVIGGVPLLGVADGTVLLSGTFTSSTVTPIGDLLSFSVTSGTDTKSAALLTALGFDANTTWTFAGFTIGLASTNVGGYVAQSTDIFNHGSIPEPGLLTLFGFGLLGVGRRLTRRRT
jgi:hypothetical protein